MKLLDHLQNLGYHPRAEEIPLDGKIHRFDREGKKNAWLIGFQNSTKKGETYVVAQFGDWKTGEQETYTSSVRMSAHDKKVVREDIQKAQKLVEIEKINIQDQAAIDAEKFWSQCTENPASDYLKTKQISKLFGCKTYFNGERILIVPMRDVDGKLWGYQQIFANRKKMFGAGQKKAGNFHIIPFKEALEDQNVIYVAEGFATAASIHEATGFAVVVAFDSGNLVRVVKALKSKYGDKSFIICGDDDRWNEKNAGRESAESAATAVLGKTIFPQFKNLSLKPTDFNDLHCIEGLELVKNQIMGVKPEFNTVQCLGYQDDIYYFISSEKPVVTQISRGSFTSKSSYLDLMPLPYWEGSFRTKTGFSIEQAANFLMTGCRKIGKFVPQHIRGAGVWQDQKRTVVNLGNCLWVDGELKKYQEFKGKYIYQSSGMMNPPREDFATTADVRKLAELINALSWKHPTSAKLLLGWLMIAPVCGSLRWRPHIWITGPSGSGKSTVMEMIATVFKNCNKVMGRSSEAGIRQMVASDAMPLLFDENETQDGKSHARVSSVIELFRQASSETQSQVVKGTISGKSIAFNVRFSACISAIRVGLTLEQDINRFAVLEMFSSKENGFNDEGGTKEKLENLITEEFSEKFTSRSIYKFGLIQENIKTFYKILQKKVSGRFADQYGNLLAGYYAGHMDKPLTEEEATMAAEDVFDLQPHISAASVKDEQECLEFLLSKKLVESGSSFSVSEIVEKMTDQNIEFEKKQFLNQVLMHHGMMWKEDFLVVQFKNPELTNLFRDSAWPVGWASALLRIPGTEQRTVRFNGTAKLSVIVKP